MSNFGSWFTRLSPGGWQRLSPFQRRMLQSAIRTGYMNAGQLNMFTTEHLNVKLVDVTRDAEYPVMVNGLITWSESANRLDELLAEIAADKPDTPDVFDSVNRIRKFLPLAASRVDEEDTTRPYRLANGLLTALIVILAALWFCLTLSVAGFLYVISLAVVILLSVASVMPLLAGPARRSGLALFAVAGSRWTTCVLIFLLLIAVPFLYLFVGLLRVAVRPGTDLGSQVVQLIERSGVLGDNKLPVDRPRAVLGLSSGQATVWPFWTWPSDRRRLVIRAGYREVSIPIGPMKRCALELSDDTPFRKLPKLVIAPDKDLFEAVFNQKNMRLAVTQGKGNRQDWIAPYQGQLVWIGPGPPDNEDMSTMEKQFGYVFNGLPASNPVIRVPYEVLTLDANCRVMIHLEIKKYPSNEWKSYDETYPRDVDVRPDPTAIAEIVLHAT